MTRNKGHQRGITLRLGLLALRRKCDVGQVVASHAGYRSPRCGKRKGVWVNEARQLTATNLQHKARNWRILNNGYGVDQTGLVDLSRGTLGQNTHSIQQTAVDGDCSLVVYS